MLVYLWHELLKQSPPNQCKFFLRILVINSFKSLRVVHLVCATCAKFTLYLQFSFQFYYYDYYEFMIIIMSYGARISQRITVVSTDFLFIIEIEITCK